jgi:hypothetical protein
VIRYAISTDDLLAEIDALKPRWRKNAAAKTERFRAAGRYTEKKGSWSEIKPVYIALQGGKCAYCERRFGTDARSAIEHDVEHFRPKSRVQRWPSEPLTYSFGTGSASDKGYYLLAYNPLNYIAACKKCNSPFKSDYFPIASTRRTRTDDVLALRKEKPFLVYPVSDIDDDPEDLISFVGLFPTPVKSRGYGNQRARVTIDFFALDDREELLRERADLIKAVFIAHESLNEADADLRAAAQQTIALLDNPRLPHRNCARAFHRLCQDDAAAAREQFRAAIAFLASLDASR